MFEKSSYKKLYRGTRWFEDIEEASSFLVCVQVNDDESVPSSLSNATVRPQDRNDIFYERGFIHADVQAKDFAALDADPDIILWNVARKVGPVEFSDDQIWAALQQYECEFRMMQPINPETRLEFKERDPIGYIECMSGMERVLYRAIGYY
ncbi:hypothetical protein [Rhizobium sp. MHM7A]|uniref:hypothetical protein n=1 Tax=Rhizobium sp. MHM7A TaxID=2583233 RepID=UPI001105B5C9|nr:hypothetical protein [Rhizobium sp. MHM7A]TLX16258.1 hypothetical protein FFR93_02720 [Rhizobium sp. MHM7A]